MIGHADAADQSLRRGGGGQLPLYVQDREPGMVADPKDYRFGGYGEAVAGNSLAREGLASVCGGKDWEETQAIYRQLLFGSGSAPRVGGGAIPVD